MVATQEAPAKPLGNGFKTNDAHAVPRRGCKTGGRSVSGEGEQWGAKLCCLLVRIISYIKLFVNTKVTTQEKLSKDMLCATHALERCGRAGRQQLRILYAMAEPDG